MTKSKSKNSMDKTQMRKMREEDSKKMKLMKEEKIPKIIVPDGVYPTNNRIYALEISTNISKSQSGIDVVTGSHDISSKTYFVAAADPNITYKKPAKKNSDDQNAGFHTFDLARLKPGDIVRPFVSVGANDYTGIYDTINGVRYTIFEMTEIAAIIPAEEVGIEVKE